MFIAKGLVAKYSHFNREKLSCVRMSAFDAVPNVLYNPVRLFRGFGINTNEAIEARCHQYYSVLGTFFLSFFRLLSYNNLSAEQETRQQSSSSSSGIIV